MYMPKKGAVVADLHHGSIFGMLPPGFMTSDDRLIPQNTGQKYLWECWQDAAISMGKLDFLVVNGDAIDGCQRAQMGTELCLPMIYDQEEAAFQTLNYLIKVTEPDEIYFTAGTEYHDGKAARSAEALAEKVGARHYRGLGTGRRCREVLDLEVDGSILNFAHGTSVAGGLYRATPPDREAIWSALAGKTGKAPKAEVVVRSHAHHFVHVEHPSKHAIITPCWQLQTRFMRKNSVYRMMPDIGYVMITVDKNVSTKGYDPCKIDKKIYPLPEPNVTHHRSHRRISGPTSRKKSSRSRRRGA